MARYNSKTLRYHCGPGVPPATNNRSPKVWRELDEESTRSARLAGWASAQHANRSRLFDKEWVEEAGDKHAQAVCRCDSVGEVDCQALDGRRKLNPRHKTVRRVFANQPEPKQRNWVAIAPRNSINKDLEREDLPSHNHWHPKLYEVFAWHRPRIRKETPASCNSERSRNGSDEGWAGVGQIDVEVVNEILKKMI